MRIENNDALIEMLAEVKVLRFLLKKRLSQLLQENPALAMLRIKDKYEFLYDDDKSFREIVDGINQVNGLIDEELDAMMTKETLWQELTSN